MKGFKASIFMLSFLFLGSCAVGPNYETPIVSLPDKFNDPEAKSSKEDLSSLKEWWTSFNDPLLDLLVFEAVSENYDLKIAIEKINEVRALYQIQAAELYPKVDLEAEEKRVRVSETLFDSPFLGPPYQNLYKVGFDASWEIDIFGKRRREKEGAYYEYEAEIQNGRDVYITLLSELASTYIDIRGLQTKIHLANRSVAIQSELYSLSKSLFDAGLNSEIDPQNVLFTLEETKANLPKLEVSYQEALHRLSVLVGKPPETLVEDIEEKRPIPISAAAIPVGLPSDLLRRRPDIRRAERLLAASTANVGSAIADLFPRFSLLGSFGFESSKSHNWIKAKSKTFSIGPNLQWPILYFGRLRANIRAQTAAQKRALFEYEQTILTSLEDVENSLVAYYREEERVHLYENQLNSAYRSYELTRDSYLSGLVDFGELLDADKLRVEAESNLCDSTKSLSTNLVALYKSLGGEW